MWSYKSYNMYISRMNGQSENRMYKNNVAAAINK